jgi:RHS repeat-associated protein
MYECPVGRIFRFPELGADGREAACNGFILRRLSGRRYQLFRHGEPAMEFEFLRPNDQCASLSRLFQGRHQILFRYNSLGRLERVIDSVARSISVVADDAGRLASLILDAARGTQSQLLVAYHYDRLGNLVKTRNEAGHGYAFEYDEAHRMVRQTGRVGFTFRFSYDEQGRCISCEGDDRLCGVSLDYTAPRRLTNVTRADGGVWAYHFDQRGALTQISDPLGGIRRFLRDETGKVVLELDQNQNATRTIYDAAGEPIAKADSLGHMFLLPEDPNAPNPADRRLPATAVEYEFGRLLDRQDIALPSRLQLQLMPLDPQGKRNILVREQSASASLQANAFPVRPLGPIWWPSPEHGRIFNVFGKLIEQRDEFGRSRHWTYDASGNPSQYVDFDGGKWLYDHGRWHLLRGITNPLGAEVRFTYTPTEEVASCVDAGGTHSEYLYDLNGHLIQVRRHGKIRDVYVRDAVGNLVAKQAGEGRELLKLEIGPGNLPIKRILASGDEHAFEYDKSGRYLVAATKRDVVEFAHDALGNCILEKRNGHGVENRFQDRNKLAEMLFFDRFAVQYQWSDPGTLNVIDPGGKRHQIRLLSNGVLERVLSNGTSEIVQYDSAERCQSRFVQRSSGQNWTRRYHWSGEGELRRVEDSRFGQFCHEYDAAHRLTRRIVEGSVEEYRMDRADNLVLQPGLNDVALREGNRLEKANGADFEYNDRNHISIRRTSDGPVRYIYDSRDQLVSVEMSKGTWMAEYDALNRRTRKIWDGKQTEYHWFGDQMLGEILPDNRVRLYIYADQLALTPFLFLEYGSIEARPESCRRYFVFGDQIGTPCLIEDEIGRECWSARIAPFGAAKVGHTSEVEFNLRFPGHYFDPELGLNYNRFRYYDPTLGRYLQSDPWGIAGGINLYAYFPNPLLNVDVRGLGEENRKLGLPCEDDTEGTAGSRLARDAGLPDAPDGYHWRDCGGKPVLVSNPGSGNPSMFYNSETGEFQVRPPEDQYPRVGFTPSERDQVFEDARGNDGVVRCPCGEPVESSSGEDMDMGHLPGHDYASARDQAIAQGTPPADFKADQKDLSNYRPEHPSCNRSHKHE